MFMRLRLMLACACCRCWSVKCFAADRKSCPTSRRKGAHRPAELQCVALVPPPLCTSVFVLVVLPYVRVTHGDQVRAAADFGGTATWIATAVQTSSVQLFKCVYLSPCSSSLYFCNIMPMFTHTGGSPRRPSHELNESASLLGIVNDSMLRQHTKAAIGA